VILEAARGLTVDVSPDGVVRIGWGEPDWFGPGGPTRPATGALADPVGVVGIRPGPLVGPIARAPKLAPSPRWRGDRSGASRGVGVQAT
jgi:hypothetical protein